MNRGISLQLYVLIHSQALCDSPASGLSNNTGKKSDCHAMSMRTCHNNLNFIQPKYLRISCFSAMSVTALAHGHWRPAANHCQDETTKYLQVE